MNKELDRADLELQLISWSKKRTAKYEELLNGSYGQNPVRDMKLRDELDEIVFSIGYCSIISFMNSYSFFSSSKSIYLSSNFSICRFIIFSSLENHPFKYSFSTGSFGN